jgi:hypothetical protein
LAVVLVAAGLSAGCVEREMTIRSNPPGALAYVDGYQIGITPITTPFLYYGNREIRLVKDGCESLKVIQPVRPPWYEVPPLDFVSENLLPGKLRDQQTFDYPLQQQAVVPSDQLLGRAEALRRGTAATPLPGVPGNAPSPQAGPALAAPPVGGQPLYPLPPSAPVAGG